jgi:hypothetical protein
MRWRVSLGLALTAGMCARADVIEFTDRDEWIAAAGRFTTIDFTGFPEGTDITDQYSDLGVTFTGGLEHIALNDNTFPNDGAGLRSSFADIQAEFATPQFWIAVDFPGILQFELYSGGLLIYTSSAFGVGGPGNFGGLVSTEPFDRANILDPTGGTIAIDDLHFGPPIPGPPALALLGLAGFYLRRRRD